MTGKLSPTSRWADQTTLILALAMVFYGRCRRLVISLSARCVIAASRLGPVISTSPDAVPGVQMAIVTMLPSILCGGSFPFEERSSPMDLPCPAATHFNESPRHRAAGAPLSHSGPNEKLSLFWSDATLSLKRFHKR